MKLLLSILKWLFLLPINIFMTLVAFIIAPILPAFASEDGWLPKWLWWFQTPDNPLDGDGGFIEKHAPYPGYGRTGKERYINRIYWLWRNPNYGFDWTVLAFEPKEGHKLGLNGTRPMGGDVSKNGWFFATCENPDGSMGWQLYITHHWNDTHTTKINCGWKLWTAPGKCQFVFSPGFWKRYA